MVSMEEVLLHKLSNVLVQFKKLELIKFSDSNQLNCIRVHCLHVQGCTVFLYASYSRHLHQPL